MRKTERMLLGAAVAGILSAVSAGLVQAADKSAPAKGEMMKVAPGDVECLGVNACKGKSSCAGSGSACASQNSCKGKGWVKVSKEVCDQLGGTTKTDAPKKS